MTTIILDATTRAAVRDATSQQAQLEALIAPWSAGQVTLRYYSAADALLVTCTHAAWAINTSTTPRQGAVGALVSESGRVTGPTAASYVIAAVPGGADILRADVSLAANVGTATGRVNLAPQTGGAGLVVTADAGLPAVPTPTWLSAIAVGEWGVVTSTSLSASGVGWSGTSPGGSGGFADVISAWGGAVINTQGFYSGSTWIDGPALVLWGGGHSNYAGNEVYCLSLNTNTPTWYRPRDPTITAPQNVAEDGSGNPVSRHTYDSIVYVGDGTRNWLLTMGGLFYYSTAGSTDYLHTFDFDVASPNSNTPWSKQTAASPGPGLYTALDATAGRVWYAPYAVNKVAYYDIATDTHAESSFKSPNFGTRGASDLDTSRGLWFINTNLGLMGYRTNNGTANDYYTVSTTGTGPATADGFLYDPDADAFIGWAGGKTIYTLTPPGTNPYAGGNSWTWSSSTPSGGATPTAVGAQGTYGRFARVVIGAAKGYIAINAADESVYFYRTA